MFYLSGDGELVDCLELDDTSLNQTNLILDYKKLGKRKQVIPAKIRIANSTE